MKRILLLAIIFLLSGCGYVQPKIGSAYGTLYTKDEQLSKPEIIYSIKIDGKIFFSDKIHSITARMKPGKHILGVKIITFYGDRAKESTHMPIVINVRANHSYRVKYYPDQHNLERIDQPVSGTIKVYDNGRLIASKKVVLADSPGRDRIEKVQQDLINDAVIYSVLGI